MRGESVERKQLQWVEHGHQRSMLHRVSWMVTMDLGMTGWLPAKDKKRANGTLVLGPVWVYQFRN